MKVLEQRELADQHLLEERIGYTFKDKALLNRALTHRSFAAEHNERLEFLGDSVLNCVIGHALFLRDKHFTEGVLSRARANFVCEKALDEIAAEIDIGAYLRLGQGEYRTGGASRPSILADACEAVFGAIFLDGGFEQAQRVILALYDPILSAQTMNPERLSKDDKTLLQEYLQGQHLPLPKYAVTRVSGAAHEQDFQCSCSIPKFSILEFGDGKSRRAAEQVAAGKALAKLKGLS
ncbi:MAG TPA: ribonuclease III [Sutterella sp.]|nr:ribonuclease III [Sutterella sp.]